MKINLIDFDNREADDLDKLQLIYQIRSLIRTYHDEELPVKIRVNAFKRMNNLTKKLTS